MQRKSYIFFLLYLLNLTAQAQVKIERVVPITTFDWVGYDDAICSCQADSNAILGTQYVFKTNVNSSIHVGYVKSNLQSSDIKSFRITYDTDFFLEGNAYTKTYASSHIADVFKFTCKNENLNKVTKITYTLCNYNGSTVSKTYKISYTTEIHH